MFVRKLIGIYHPDTKFPYQLSSKLRLKYMTYYVTKLLTARYFNYKPWPDLKFKSYPFTVYAYPKLQSHYLKGKGHPRTGHEGQ